MSGRFARRPQHRACVTCARVALRARISSAVAEAGFVGTCPSGYGGCNFNYWGNNGEVSFIWNVATHYVDQMLLGLGYTGQLKTKDYPDHVGEKHHYTIQLGDVIRRDDVAFYMQ